MSELQWGFYHLTEDETEESNKFKTLLEAMMGLLNPEAYKKYKKSKTDSNVHTSETFLQEVMQQSGMTEEEARAFMESKDGVKDETLDVIMDPIST